jgi:PAS domain S-box-containing protein
MGKAAPTRTPETQLFHDVFSACPIGIAVENLEGQPLFVNPALCSFLGFSEEELRNKHCVDFSPREESEKDRELFQQLRAGLIDHYQLEKRYFRRDGSLVWGRLIISLLKNRPSPLVLAMVEDITDKKKAEEALRTSEERVRLAQQAARIGAFEWNIRTGVNTWTPELEAMYGLLPGSFGGTQTAFENLVHPDDRARVLELNDSALKTGQPTKGEWRVVWSDGSVHWIAGRWQVFMNESGEPSIMVGMNMDITDRKRSEQELARANERLHLAIESGSAGGWDYDFQTGTNLWFGTAHAQLGVTPDETAGSLEEFWARVHEDDREHLQHAIWAARDRHEEFVEDFRVVWRDGTTHWLRSRGRYYYAASGEPERALGISIDITDRKQVEEALLEMNRSLEAQGSLLQSREELLRVFVKNVPAAIAMLDSEMRYLQVSDRWCSDYLPGRTEILGRSHHEIFPDMPERWKEVHRRALQGETLRADEDRWDGQDGPHWARWEVRPWKTAEGAVGGILILAEDITRRKQMEEALSDLSRKLIESQEQERARIGRELHDDINQRLAMLSIELERLQNDPSELQNRVQELRKQMSEILTDVQALSHDLHSSKLEYLGVAAGMKSWCKEFSERQKLEIDFRSIVPSALPLEVGLSLFRILQEALNNVIKHSAVRRVDVRLREDSGEIHLVISDRGRGFDVEAALQGKGLGLTSMRERVRLLNGTIAIESKPNAGTTIRVRVPLGSGKLSKGAVG